MKTGRASFVSDPRVYRRPKTKHTHKRPPTPTYPHPLLLHLRGHVRGQRVRARGRLHGRVAERELPGAFGVGRLLMGQEPGDG